MARPRRDIEKVTVGINVQFMEQLKIIKMYKYPHLSSIDDVLTEMFGAQVYAEAHLLIADAAARIASDGEKLHGEAFRKEVSRQRKPPGKPRPES